MDIDDILDSTASSSSELIVTSEMRGFLKETAKWGKFLAITGFVMMGLGILGMLIGGGAILAESAGGMGLGGFGGGIMLMYLLIFVLYIFPLLYLYRFSVNTQKALMSDDQMFLRDAFENLKSLFKFSGIFMAIILGVYLLMIVGGLLFALVADL